MISLSNHKTRPKYDLWLRLLRLPRLTSVDFVSPGLVELGRRPWSSPLPNIAYMVGPFCFLCTLVCLKRDVFGNYRL